MRGCNGTIDDLQWHSCLRPFLSLVAVCESLKFRSVHSLILFSQVFKALFSDNKEGKRGDGEKGRRARQEGMGEKGKKEKKLERQRDEGLKGWVEDDLEKMERRKGKGHLWDHCFGCLFVCFVVVVVVVLLFWFFFCFFVFWGGESCFAFGYFMPLVKSLY